MGLRSPTRLIRRYDASFDYPALTAGFSERGMMLRILRDM